MAKRRTVRIDIGVIQITPCTLLCIFLFGYVLHFIGFFSPFWVVEGCHEKGLFYSCSDCLLLNNTRIKACFIHNWTCKYITVSVQHSFRCRFIHFYENMFKLLKIR
jgi:hypothetical protein